MTLREQFTRMDIIFSASIFLTISQDTITDVHEMNRILPQVHSCPLWTLTLNEQDIATNSQLSTVDTDIR
jgi:hypothetical protein